MQSSTDYLPISAMQNGIAYAICARNAYVGVWLPARKGFLISRYKFSATPYLFVEYHWDTGEPYGTAKPLRAIESCPLPIVDMDRPTREDGDALCAWLDALENAHPPIPGWESVAERLRDLRRT